LTKSNLTRKSIDVSDIHADELERQITNLTPIISA